MSMPIQVAIVEDDDHDRAILKGCLIRYAKDKDIHLNIREYTDGEDLVIGYSADYDLILMDIHMRFLDGMRAAGKIREVDQDVALIFITNLSQYAIEGYKVRAADYLIKPLNDFSFAECINRVLPQINRERRRDTITIPHNGGKMKLETDLIRFIEVQDHDIIFVTNKGRYISKGTMKDLEERLNPDQFCRCNRCYLVNLQYVDSYQGTNVTVAGDQIQVSRGRKKAFLDALNLYMNRHG